MPKIDTVKKLISVLATLDGNLPVYVMISELEEIQAIKLSVDGVLIIPTIDGVSGY